MPSYPPTAFHFKVAIGPPGQGATADASFQEVSGIQVQSNSEDVVEGGENRFTHRLPTAAKFANLVLKRGVVVKNSPLAKWVADTLGGNLSKPIAPKSLTVFLLDEKQKPLISWAFTHAYPVRWDISAMNAMENALLTETMELSYHYFEVVS
jgi:phage tail-like protein